MEPTTTPLDATFGATITDIDLAQLDEATWQSVEDAFHEYAALIFPEQHLDDAAQIAFALRFGEMELLRDDPEIKAVSVSNRRASRAAAGASGSRAAATCSSVTASRRSPAEVARGPASSARPETRPLRSRRDASARSPAAASATGIRERSHARRTTSLPLSASSGKPT